MMIAKSFKWMVVVILLVAAVALVLFVRMYRGDIKALHSFLASYEDFDRAIVAAVEGRDGPAGLGQAEKALTELQAKASMRLSSLIRNDGDLMVRARDVAALSRRELDRLRALDVRPRDPGREPAGGANSEALSRAYDVLRDQRKSAFSRFMELAGRNGRVKKLG